jgi:shikimate dehydrogenase
MSSLALNRIEPVAEARAGVAVAGVIGWPIDHSRSPKLHSFWLQERGLDGHYSRLPVAPEQLREAMRGLPALGFRGVNVTVPHKETVMAYLDEIDPVAQQIGAVNTVVVTPRGRLIGFNTDAEGFWRNLILSQPDVLEPTDKRALVLGAGGAARAVVAALLANGFTTIRVANRTPDRAQRLALEMGDMRIQPLVWGDRHAAVGDLTLLVNTTSLGMKGQPAMDYQLGVLPRGVVVCDLVYTPVHTPLLLNARMEGLKTVDGLGMLIHQAAPAFRRFFDVDPPMDADTMARLRLHLMK